MKNNFLIVLLCAAFVALYIYAKFEVNPVKVLTPEKFPTEINVHAISDSVDMQFQSELSRLETENDSLKSVIKSDKQSLIVSKKKVFKLQQNVELLSQQFSFSADTTQKIELCDSLQKKVSVLITESVIRDSLCDKTVDELSELTQMQDSSLDVCKNSYSLLKQHLDISLAQQDVLTDNLNLSEKKLKRKSALNRWLAGGLALAGGILTTTILLH
ncbi:MAG TPA: hypothetical protein DDX39_12115 [Bacteroidales bacterium]|nr:MAG: hypothetical protein A2W98_11520 [Bacteroidetes bacterium GWF2_33_38]OFY74864.1 MAG: hypothetical protein A2265_04095 [Bacteroidetes bacterium RIFOXYA12_FULL_33_9]OFY92070.1 MAG: hypothetical protein A2236_08930 [Bacteroidetes bacterium RIFOXYA2_FULL_33_7]HBF89377.1 hypothetical protein [Bacteroidales bacterium]